MFTKVLIANRGEIALRIIKTLKKMGIQSVAIYSVADEGTPHTREANEAYCVGPSSPSESYLNIDKIIQIAKQSGAQAVHPGYGFLSENAEFARRCTHEGIVFIGPTVENMISFGLKHEAKRLAEASNVPCLPGSALLQNVQAAVTAAEVIGYPVLLKSTAGGGGIGMHVCNDADELSEAFHKVKTLGESFFNCGDVFLEKFIPKGRHIEVQIFGDGKGNVVILGERDCSIQRRRQKIIEETPSPFVDPTLRELLFTAARSLAENIKYKSAGTIEFLVDVRSKLPYFLEVNTRLQVEHGVTEFVTGLDLVEWMVRLAAGEDLKLKEYTFSPVGHSIQVRLYAEVPSKDFQPSPGALTEVVFPANIRVDTWVAQGTEVSPEYDPLLAKLISYGSNREEALEKLIDALKSTKIHGIQTNLHYLLTITQSDAFRKGEFSTRFLEDLDYVAPMIEVLDGGMDTTIQDYPGRTTGWAIGVPPSGPMDDVAFRIANRLVGNEETCTGLEITVSGPAIKFYCDSVIAVTGAQIVAEIDGNAIQLWAAIKVKRGSILTLGDISSSGSRSYLAIQFGIDVPLYLNSHSTFALGKFGGHHGRRLIAGDLLPLNSIGDLNVESLIALPDRNIPTYPTEWKVSVMIGPHTSPDFFTDDSMTKFYQTFWKVHYNSNRLGVRLQGPKPEWTRKDGGDAGLHPSNIHDCVYAVGSVNFTGDMPVILTCDGPSLGGFVCPCTIVKSELWKVGQMRPGDTIQFVPVDRKWALENELFQDEWILNANTAVTTPFNWNLELNSPSLSSFTEAIIHQTPPSAHNPLVIYRQAGDKYVLIEYGPLELDFTLRFRVHALMEHLTEQRIGGIIELSPGVRSLQVHFDSRKISLEQLMEVLLGTEARLPNIEDISVPTRIIKLPIAFNDSATLDAIKRYQQSVRSEAPYLPSNIEFMRRINGLEHTDAVFETILKATYMIFGLGDVYLGAPCAVPLDPRHRLVTSKYNPARTYTPEGDVGIGGVYMCIYGMDSPGGYQLVGRTLPIWNKYVLNTDFEAKNPWLFQFFDQIQFYQVTETEIVENRKKFLQGSFHIDIQHEVFKLKDYLHFLQVNATDIDNFKKIQQTAFNQEVSLWKQQDEENQKNQVSLSDQEENLQDPYHLQDPLHEDKHLTKVLATISGNVWAVFVQPGDHVTKGTKLLTLEAMKMEFNICSTVTGIIHHVTCLKGNTVKQGQLLLTIKTNH